MKILVLGGAGYIGSHTVYELIDNGNEVVIIDSLETGHMEAVHSKAKFYKGDLRDKSFVDRVLETESDIDAVIHFAAYSLVGESMVNPLKYYDNNMCGTKELLQSMVEHGVDKIVFSSTAATYGEPERIPIQETDRTCPTNTYGETKLSMEKMFKWTGMAHGIRFVSLRYFNACGAHKSGEIGEAHNPESHLIPLILQVPNGQRDYISVFGNDYPTKDGTCVRDYIHVTDLAQAHILAVKYLMEGNDSDIFNLGNGVGFTVREVIDVARKVTGREIKAVDESRRAGDPAVLIASSEKAKRILGWKPEHADLEEIVASAWKWHSTHPNGYGKTENSKNEKTDELINDFREVYGNAGDIRCFFAPGRVNLIGEHTDYNGGHVFPCALTLGTYAVVRKREDRKLRFFSKNYSKFGMVESSLDDLVYNDNAGWTNYPKGVLWALEKRGCHFDSGFDVLIYGDIPNGSGLSSSASLEVLTGLMVRELYKFSDLSMIDIAQIGQYAENNFNGMNCGIMDQFASAMGKKDCAIFLDTNTLSYEYANINLPNAKIVITNSKVKHSLVDSAYNERRRQCEQALAQLQEVVNIKTLGDLDEDTFESFKTAIKDPVCRKRAKHAVYENQRTIKAVAALKEKQIILFGELMNESHRSLRDDYETSCKETDILVEAAWSLPGVIGSRITGGGFGGCTVSIVEEEEIDTFITSVGEIYKSRTGITAEFYVVDIGAGAHVIK